MPVSKNMVMVQHKSQSNKNAMKQGFIKVASAIPLVRVGDCKYNTEQIMSLVEQAEKRDV